MSRLALPLLLLTACQAGGGTRSLSWDPQDVGIIDIALSSGEVRVSPGDTDQIEIHWEGGGIADEPIFEVSQEGPRLFIDADCGFTCGGELRVGLPAAIPLEIALDSGEVDVELTERSSVAACVATGEIDLTVPAGAWRLDLDAAAGEVNTHGVHHDEAAKEQLSACVAAGEISVHGED